MAATADSDHSKAKLEEFRSDAIRKERPLLKDLDNHVVPQWATMWEQLGMQLDVPDNVLRIINTDYPANCEGCCSKMLQEWLDSNNKASWEILTDAIDKLTDHVTAVTRVTFAPGIHGPVFSDKGMDRVDLFSKIVRRYNLQAKFRANDDTWPPDYSKNYTPLLLIHHEGYVYHSLEQENDLDVFFGVDSNKQPQGNIVRTYTKELEEILFPFENGEDSNMVLIEGQPGIGKSVLLAEIAYRWGKNLILKMFKFVLLIHLRDPSIQNATNVKDLLQLFCKGDERASEISSDCSSYLYNNGGKDVIFLFDGLDEFPNDLLRKNKLIDGIMKRQVLQECGLIVSSRPHASSHLRQEAVLRVLIRGFAQEEKEQFIQQSLLRQPQKANELKTYLNNHVTLNGLCDIPFNMVILVYLCKQGIPFPSNSTELYEHFICLTICRHLAKHGHSLDDTISDLANVPTHCKPVIKQLSKLSFLGMNKDTVQVTFAVNEVKLHCPVVTTDPEAVNGFGLLKAVQQFGLAGKTMVFSFIHLSIQEFLAAYHIISDLTPDEEITLLQQKFWSEPHFNMFSYYTTLSKGQQPSFKKFLQQPTIMQRLRNFFLHRNTQDNTIWISHKFLDDHLKCFRLYHCFHEAGDEEMYQSIQNSKKFDNNVLDLKNINLTIHDLECLVLFLTTSPQQQWNKIDLNGCNIQDEGFKVLQKRLLNSDITIRVLKLENNGLTHASSCGIAELTMKCKVEVLGISGNTTIGEDHTLYDIMAVPSSQLVRVAMRNIKLSSTAAIAMFKALAVGKTVQWLYMRFNDINDSFCGIIVDTLKKNCTLERLEISNNPISATTAECIVKALNDNNNLQELYLPGFYSQSCQKSIVKLQKGINTKRNARSCSRKLNITFED